MGTVPTTKGFSTLTKFSIIFSVLVAVAGLYAAFGASAGVRTSLTLKPESLATGLVAHWTFDDTDVHQATGIVDDVSGNGYNASTTGMTTATTTEYGIVGSRAFVFDGNNDRVNFNTITLSGPLTISFWWKTNTLNTYKFAIGDAGTGSKIGINATGNNAMFIRVVSASGADVSSVPMPSAGVWHHIVVKRNTANKVDAIIDGGTPIRLYADAAQIGDSTWTRIGDGSSQFFQGSIDDVRIYDRALSANEISQLYAMQAGSKVGTTSAPPSLSDANSGLIGHWTFDGKDTLTGQINDVSGSGNNASVTNLATSTMYVSGAVGQALRSPGLSGGYVRVGSAPAYAFTSAFSVSAWVRPRASALSGTPRIVARRAGNNGYLLSPNAGAPRLLLGTGASIPAVTSSVALVAEEWQLVSATWNGTNLASIYVNGVQTGTGARTILTDAGVDLAIGAEADGTSAFAGDIDDVRIYNRAISASEVKQLYELGATTKVGVAPDAPRLSDQNSGLLGHWTFDGKDTLTGQINDVSGSGNDGSAINMATSTMYVSGKIGQALAFNGTTNELQIPDGPTLTTNATIAGWFYWDTSDPDFSSLLRDNTAGNGWILAYESGGTFLFRAGNSQFDTGVAVGPYRNTWTHYAFTKSGGTVVYYLNGAQVYSGTGAGSTASLLPWHVMKNGISGIGTYLKGKVDDLYMYNRALSPVEIKQLYDMGR